MPHVRREGGRRQGQRQSLYANDLSFCSPSIRMLFCSLCVSVCTIERLSAVKDLLGKSKRVVFPVITPSGSFAGLILRR